MRYLVGFVLLLLALGTVRLVGCSEATPECQIEEDCDDQNECTEDACEGGFCENTVVEDGTECGESTECTVAACASGACELTIVPDGTACGNDAGTCQQGSCQVACTEQGVRDAIAAGGGPYTFGCDGPTTVVTEDTIHIDRGPTILDGEGSLTIDGNDNHLAFLIRGRQVGSQTYEDVTLELRGITITKGADVCGAIWNFGTLTLTNSTVSGNSDRAICNEGTLTLTSSTVSDNGCTIYAFGAGISNVAGTATLTDSTVSGNTCAEAAGISNLGTMTLTNSIVSGNSAEGSSGGIYNKGTMTLINSTVSDNSAGWTGGGIVNSFQAKLTLTNSTVSDNSAVWAGGGIHNAQPTGGIGGTLTLTNSTVSGNTASASDGGGIFNWGTTTTTTTLANSTVSGNSAGAQGGGIFGYQSALTLIHTLVDNDCYWSESEVTSGGYNIESPGNTCGLDPDGTDLVNVTAEQLNLGKLADNGGPTKTHALGAGSVAIDVISVEECVDTEGAPLTTDQRGVARPQGDSCDVGAFELEVAP